MKKGELETAIELIKLRWFLIGYFSSNEDVSIHKLLNCFKDLLEKGDESALKLIIKFYKLLDEEKRDAKSIVEISSKILDLIK